MSPPRLVVLAGATATGKTDLALDVVAACAAPVEIISLDSRQLYRGLDVGTGKPTSAQLAAAPHHMLDVLSPTQTYDAAAYRRAVEHILPGIRARGAVPLFVGGAGFYLRALREGFLELDFDPGQLAEVRTQHDELSLEELRRRLGEVDPLTLSRLHPHDRYRIGRALEIHRLSGIPSSEHQKAFRPQPIEGSEFDVVVLSPPRNVLRERIARRTAYWLRHGWREEVLGLRAAGIAADAPGLRILGYRQVGQWIDGELDEAGCEAAIRTQTQRYARQQETWFRKEDASWAGAAEDPGAVPALVSALEASSGRGLS